MLFQHLLDVCLLSFFSFSLPFFFFFSFHPSTLSRYLFIHPSLFASLYLPINLSISLSFHSYVHASVSTTQLYAPIIEVTVTACECRRRTPQMKLYGVIIVGARQPTRSLRSCYLFELRASLCEPDVREPGSCFIFAKLRERFVR